MGNFNEYVPCTCGAWARIHRAEDKQHRDRIICPVCGSVTITDNIPSGVKISYQREREEDIFDD